MLTCAVIPVLGGVRGLQVCVFDTSLKQGEKGVQNQDFALLKTHACKGIKGWYYFLGKSV